jgi:hypothetical protein
VSDQHPAAGNIQYKPPDGSYVSQPDGTCQRRPPALRSMGSRLVFRNGHDAKLLHETE